MIKRRKPHPDLIRALLSPGYFYWPGLDDAKTREIQRSSGMLRSCLAALRCRGLTGHSHPEWDWEEPKPPAPEN